ncbi:MAG: terpene cyclase/mutase family protein [Planctomycetia bacterium]|nr:terpene cyclase/mutase family protein [Planctomycetia bacterium]
MKRPLFFASLFAALGWILSGATLIVSAQTSDPALATERGLQYFREKLDAGVLPGDGAFKNHAAISALVGMAFLSNGSTPYDGPDAKYVRMCLLALKKQVRDNGLIASEGVSEQSMMYAHGFALTFFAECYGMCHTQSELSNTIGDAELRGIIEKGIELIVAAQNQDGGWRYSVVPKDEDVSVSACLLVALRACRNAGIDAPAETVERGIDYLLQCQNPDGGFRYRLAEGPSAYPRSAAVVAALCAAGEYETEPVQKALRYLDKFPAGAYPTSDGYYFYAQYYAVQAYRLCATNEAWSAWYATAAEELCRTQRSNGAWSSAISIDYATASAIIVLTAPKNFLPVFER